MPRASCLLPALLALAGFFLAGCDRWPITTDDEISFAGEVAMSDGRPVRVSGEASNAVIDITNDHLVTSFYVARPDENGIIVSMAADLPDGDSHDRNLPMRVCSCHLLPGREGEDVVPTCEVDEERVCTDVTAKMTGVYQNDDCDDQDCLAILHATFAIPSGFEFGGSVSLVHEERGYSPADNPL